jgi:hypothetical protein
MESKCSNEGIEICVFPILLAEFIKFDDTVECREGQRAQTSTAGGEPVQSLRCEVIEDLKEYFVCQIHEMHFE